MTIEIVQHVTCPTCNGTGRVWHGGTLVQFKERCGDCNGKDLPPVVLATFSDAGALRTALEQSMRDAEYATEVWTGSPLHPPAVPDRRVLIDVDNALTSIIAALGVSHG